MNLKTLTACAAIMACLGGVSLMAQAQTPGSTTETPYRVGDIARDTYRSSAVAIIDWQQKGLRAPITGSQWVQINDRYVLVQRDTGEVLAIAPTTR